MILEFDEKSYIFPLKTCQRTWNENFPSVSLNAVIGGTLKIPDQSEVHLRKVDSSLTKLNKVVVDPLNEEDWDILVSLHL